MAAIVSLQTQDNKILSVVKSTKSITMRVYEIRARVGWQNATTMFIVDAIFCACDCSIIFLICDIFLYSAIDL